MGLGLDLYTKLAEVETKINDKMNNMKDSLINKFVDANPVTNLTTLNEDIQKIIITHPLINDNATVWTKIALPTGVTHLTKVIYAGGKFVAVGNAGMILISENGYRWDLAYNTASSKDLNNIAYINGLYIAVGKSMTVLTSPDALVWTMMTTPIISGVETYDLYGIAYDVLTDGRIKYIITGGYGILYAITISSLDSKTWTEEVPSTTVLDTYGKLIKVGNYTYIASINSPIIYDMMALTNKVAYIDEDQAGTERIVNFAYGNGKIIGVGANAIISNILNRADTDNAAKWKNDATADLQYTFSDIIFYNNLFFIISKNGLGFWSLDGLKWESMTITIDPLYIDLESICCNGDKYIAIGDCIFIADAYNPIDSKFVDNNALFCNGYGVDAKSGGCRKYIIIDDFSSTIQSYDGINWTYIICDETANSSTINSAAFVNNKIIRIIRRSVIVDSVEVTRGVISISENGINWHEYYNDLLLNKSYITYGNGIYVAIGDNGEIITSPDLITWTVRTSNASTALNNIIYANNMFIIVSGWVIITSPDGITWTVRTSNASTALNNIIYANNMFIAVGASGVIITSSDGITWTVRTSGTTTLLKIIIYANNMFVIGGSNGIILTSPDGITWTVRTNDITNMTFTNIIYANNMFIIVSGGIIVTSLDGINWTIDTVSISNSYPLKLIYLDTINEYKNVSFGSFVVSTQSGTINLKFTPKRVYIISQTKNNLFCKINISDMVDFTVRSVKTKTYTIQQLTESGTPECIINTGNSINQNGFNYQLPAEITLYTGVQYNYYAIE